MTLTPNTEPRPSDTFPGEVGIARCPKHGPYEAYVLNGVAMVECSKCVDAQNAARDHAHRSRYEQRMRGDRIRSLQSMAMIPALYAEACFSDYVVTSEPQRLALAICQGFLSMWPEKCVKGRMLTLIGRTGTGKTRHACTIGNGVIAEHQGSVVFGTASQILRQFHMSWAKNSPRNEEAVLNAFIAPDLLIIDEVGAKLGLSEHDVNLLFEIIDQREKAKRAVIVTSNLTRDQLIGHLGERAVDRLEGGGPVVPFTWDSYRTQKQGALL